MKDSQVLIDNFLSTIEQPNLRVADRISKLGIAIDALTLEAQQVSFVFDEKEYPDPPVFNESSYRRLVEKSFPILGYYNTVSDVSDRVGETTFTIGDAIDDIVDIAKDLTEVKWRLKNTSSADALFYFQLFYRSHWGRHARDLQLFLHDFN